MKKYLNFKVIITQDEDGVFVATCPAIPGCHSQGSTYEEAEKNIKEAIKLCLKVAEEDEEYRKSIDFQDINSPRFIGITNIPINFSISF
ncbi:MAG: HicB family protein [Patescibacteria group bacterium]|nr:MAG: HicB family protein [Patescibacteria group bacterium]